LAREKGRGDLVVQQPKKILMRVQAGKRISDLGQPKRRASKKSRASKKKNIKLNEGRLAVQRKRGANEKRGGERVKKMSLWGGENEVGGGGGRKRANCKKKGVGKK